MRKVLLLALCFLILGSTAFALDMVIGGGGLFGWAWETEDYPATWDPSTGDQFWATIIEQKATKYGGYVFFGLNRYFEANIFVLVGKTTDIVIKYTDDDGIPHADDGESYDTNNVGVGLYLKYPFSLGSNLNLVFFPTIGADFQSNSGGLDVFLGGGLGLDIFFGQKLFLRAQGIYRYGFPFIYKGDLLDTKNFTSTAHGPLFKLGLGWMY